MTPEEEERLRRKRGVRAVIITLFFVFLFLAVLIVAGLRYAGLTLGHHDSGESHKKAVWHTQWTAAMQEAKENRGVVLVDYYADWCDSCRRMQAELFPREEFRALTESYRVALLRVDASNVPAGTGVLVRPFEVKGFPTLILSSSDGRELESMEGYFSIGNTMLRLETALRRIRREGSQSGST